MSDRVRPRDALSATIAPTRAQLARLARYNPASLHRASGVALATVVRACRGLAVRRGELAAILRAATEDGT